MRVDWPYEGSDAFVAQEYSELEASVTKDCEGQAHTGRESSPGSGRAAIEGAYLLPSAFLWAKCSLEGHKYAARGVAGKKEKR